MNTHLRIKVLLLLLFFLCFQKLYTSAQNTYEITEDGSLVLDPPTQYGADISNLANYDTEALGWIYDATKVIIFGLSRGILPTFEKILSIGNLCQPTSFLNATIISTIWESNRNELMNWLLGILILGIVTCLLCITICLTCLIVTCCRCLIFKCGAEKSQSISSGRNFFCISFWSILLCLTLFIIIAGCGFGIMAAISLNTYFSSIPSSYQTVVDSVGGVFNGIVDEINFLYPTQFEATVDAISTRGLSLFEEGFGLSVDQLSMELDASIGIINSITNNAIMLQEILSNSTQLINELSNSAVSITNDLVQTSTYCTSLNNLLLTLVCDSIPNNIDINGINTTSLPDVDTIVNNLQMLNTNQLSEIVNNITMQINSSLGDLTNLNISNIISTTPLDLSFIMSALLTFNQTLDTFLLKDILGSEIFNYYFKVIETVIFVLCLLFFVVILVLLLLPLFGAFLSFIGYDKNRTPSQRNSKSNAGGNCLAVFGYAGFFTICVLIPLLILLFYLGSISTTVCQPLVDRSLIRAITPEVQNCFNIQIQIPNQGNVEIKVNLEDILTICSTSSGNTSNLFEALNATAIIDNIIMEANSILNTSVSQILGDIDFSSTINSISSQFTDVLDQYNTDSYDLSNIISLPANLNSSILSLSIANVKTQLIAINFTLNLLNNATFDPLKSDIEIIYDNVIDLEVKLNEATITFNQNLARADTIISDLMANIQQINSTLETSQQTVNNILQNTSSIITSLTSEFTTLVNNYGNTYLSYFRKNFPGCNFISIYYDIIVNFTCRRPLDNLNSLWFCLAWALIFLLFAVIFSFILARYSQKRKHEAGFDQQNDEVVAISPSQEYPTLPPRGSLFANSASAAGIYVEPTAPSLQATVLPPPYTYMSETYEMERISTSTDTPVLTTAQFNPDWMYPPPPVQQ